MIDRTVFAGSRLFPENEGEIADEVSKWFSQKSMRESIDRQRSLFRLLDKLDLLKKYEDKIPSDVYLELLEGLRYEYKEI